LVAFDNQIPPLRYCKANSLFCQANFDKLNKTIENTLDYLKKILDKIKKMVYNINMKTGRQPKIQLINPTAYDRI